MPKGPPSALGAILQALSAHMQEACQTQVFEIIEDFSPIRGGEGGSDGGATTPRNLFSFLKIFLNVCIPVKPILNLFRGLQSGFTRIFTHPSGVERGSTPPQTLINNNIIYIYILVYIMETRGVKKGVKGGESRGRVVKKAGKWLWALREG